jgi:hypothetical protein
MENAGMNEGHVYHATQEQDFRESSETMRPATDFVQYLQEYARERPEVVALWCFGIGFVLGWKLKPW